MTDTFANNTEKQRFEYHVGNELAFANYTIEGDTLYIQYVEAAPALRGSGAASKLMQYVIDQSHDKKIIPICGYAAAWMRKHKIE